VEILKQALAVFFGFKAYVMLPIVILVLALIVRLKVGEALLSTLKVAVGFAGIPIVIGYLLIATALSPLYTRLAALPKLDPLQLPLMPPADQKNDQ